MRESKMRQYRDITAKCLLALCVGTPALALGAVHSLVLACFVTVAAVIFGFLFFSTEYRVSSLDAVGGIFAVLISFTLIQIIPLPPVVVEWISSAVYDVRSRALGPLGDAGQSWMPLTLDVTFTTLELGKLLLYLAVYWLTLSYTRRHGIRFAINVITATGIVAASVFLAHRILLLDKIYGVYIPLHLSPRADRISAPLINGNHMAGLLGLVTAVAIGKALAVSERSKRLLIVGIAALLGGALMLTLSRGGIAAFVAGQSLFVLLRVVRKQKRLSPRATPVHLAWLPLGLALSLSLGFFAAQDAILGEFMSGSIRKVDLAFEGIPLIGRFFSTGVGRGAFWVGFPLVSDLAANATFTHAENSIIQLLSDWGVVVGGFALLSLALVVGRYLKEVPRRVELMAAVAALVAFGIHNLADFNGEIPGVAVVAVALVGVLRGGQAPENGLELGRVPRTSMIVVAVGSLAVAVTTALYLGERSVDAEQREFKRAWEENDDRPFSSARLKESLERHPADWYTPFIVGARHFHRQDANPLPWLARAVELNPSSALAHYYIGKTLLRAGYMEQALLEFRLAARFKHRLASPAAQLLVDQHPRFRDLSKMAVTQKDKLLLWPAIARALVVSGHAKEAETADLAVLKIDPKNPTSLARHVRRLASRGETDEALKLARTLLEIPDFGPAGAELTAEIYQRLGEHGKAVRILEKALTEHAGHPRLLKILAWSRQRAGDHRGALDAAGLVKASATTMKGRSEGALLEARLCLAEGRIQEALARFREASLMDRSNVSILTELADLAERHGDEKRAVEALRELRRLSPDDESIGQRLSQIERRDKTKLELRRQIDDNE